jgi:hypothetical protein
VKFGELVLSMFVAVAVVGAAVFIRDAKLETDREQTDLVGQLKRCQAQLKKEQTARSTAEQAVANTDYFVWEVHTVDIHHDPRDPKDDGQLPGLCESLGDHSVLKANTQLSAYSLWSDPAGRQKLGCRYVQRRTQ